MGFSKRIKENSIHGKNSDNQSTPNSRKRPRPRRHGLKNGFKSVAHPFKTYDNFKENTTNKIENRKNQFIKDQVNTDKQSKEQLQGMLKIILFSVVAIIVLMALKLL